jgi:hypothetical protein
MATTRRWRYQERCLQYGPGRCCFNVSVGQFFPLCSADLRSPEFVSNFALRPEGTDVSAGDALVADGSIFQKIPKPPDGMPSPRSVYWQIGSQLGRRYVLVEDAFGWRGDQYTLFAINDDMTASQFFERSDSPSIAPLIEETWRPPLMLREPSGDVWAIDVGPPYVTFSDWRVYSVGGDGAKALYHKVSRPG